MITEKSRVADDVAQLMHALGVEASALTGGSLVVTSPNTGDIIAKSAIGISMDAAGSASNAGQITAETGIVLAAGGVAYNFGRIAASADGVNLAAVAVYNYQAGTIIAGGSAAVSFAGAGYVYNAGQIAAAALDSETRLAGFVMGTNDLAKDTRARLVPGRAPMLPWLMTCVAAARAYGLDILDGVYNDLGNAEGFVEECKQARDLGFDGKTLIHPRQIEPCNDAFSPTPEEVEVARKMIAAFDLPENKDKGVIQLEGRMVERQHADMGRRIVAIADAIAKRQST